jgi:hypothetical protein
VNIRVVTMSALVALLAGFGAGAAGIDREQQYKRFMQAASERVPAIQRQALARIENDDQRNLAMTYYLRAGTNIESRWSWTQAEIETYRRSAEARDATVEIEKIAAWFAKKNPNHRLYVNTQVRSLEEQLRRWQTVRSIDVAASELRRAATTELERASYSATPDEKSLTVYIRFLVGWRAARPPTLAAPGLSLHGRGRAYDFQVRDEQGRTIAGTDSSTIRTVWDAQGWTEKLADAVHGASDRFVGPLEAPRGPWHYQYRPRD